MRDKATPEDIAKVLEKLRAVWLVNPHMRLGQLLINLAYYAGANDGDIEQHLWNMDEKDVLDAIDRWLAVP